jgi:hypothetical protein
MQKKRLNTPEIAANPAWLVMSFSVRGHLTLRNNKLNMLFRLWTGLTEPTGIANAFS